MHQVLIRTSLVAASPCLSISVSNNAGRQAGTEGEGEGDGEGKERVITFPCNRSQPALQGNEMLQVQQ